MTSAWIRSCVETGEREEMREMREGGREGGGGRALCCEEENKRGGGGGREG